MAPEKDLYEVLGIERGATEKEIKAAHRRLARKYHPDVNPGNPEAEQRFKEIQAAYNVLSDKEKRKQYDTYGSSFFSPHGGPGGGPGMEWDEFVRQFASRGMRVEFGGSGFDVFGDLFGRAGATQTRADTTPRRGEDVYQPVTIDFLEAAKGTTVIMELVREITCDRCNGSGADPDAAWNVCPTCNGTGQISRGASFFRQTTECPHCRGKGSIPSKNCMRCRGSGLITKRERIEVKIPAGIDTGSKVRVPGKGSPGRNGGPYGDLLLNVTVRPHPYFHRQDSNVTLEVPITIAEALLGGEIEIPTLDKHVRMKIPPGTDSGREFRLKGKGFPRLSRAGRGDLLVRVKIVTPKRVSARGRELISEFAEDNPINPRLKMFGF
ncbi:molecular chaperone DnaJ [bacterium]|nr:molecular chaperone DnaJ [bacterium]